MKKPGKDTPATGKAKSKAKANGQINPKQVTSQPSIEMALLENSLREPIQSKAREQEAEGGYHGHDTEVCWGKQAGQYHGGNHLDGKAKTLEENSNPTAADGQAFQLTILSDIAERAAGIKRIQLVSAWKLDEKG